MSDTTKTYSARENRSSTEIPGGAREFAREFVGKFSRRLSRMVPFRPFNLKLERPLVSFTFDDFACSAARDAAPALEDAGMRGTFYYAGGLAGLLENGQEIARPDVAADLFSRGHEIGAHTHGHLDVHRTSNRAILEDMEINKRQIAELTDGRAPTSFAYPFGRLDLRSKFLLRQEFGSLRGIKTGVNSGIIDLAHLKAQELYDSSSTIESMNRLLDRVEKRPGWLIFYTHDVKRDPSTSGCSPAYFSAVVDLVRRRGLTVETVADAYARITGQASVAAA
ncbi:MAG: polysaccharide deacetylase family protein [Mesorhizobium sp.]|nr:polysaccharide deacetylase family protein [Mesorhizobium sp.]MBN9245630.1 polysaccharide deacetylase family protein [Mesorhizobium sp.]